MWWIITIISSIIIMIIGYFNKLKFNKIIINIAIMVVLNLLIILIDYDIKTNDIEIWSGRVIDLKHEEEWSEFIPPKEVEKTKTDINGKKITTTEIIPGYWKHHPAVNKIKTTDKGWITVYNSPDGRKFNNKWPNTTEELEEFWPIGSPSASVHTYKNYLKASSSLYKHGNINIEDYDLPEYPKEVKDYITIDRLIGEVPNKKESSYLLSEWNSELNKMIEDEENPGKKRSWKQVNLIFVNVGENKPYDYGFALQEKWKNGSKNDFVVSFSMNKDNYIDWVYVFSWTEVEILKIEVRDLLLNQDKIEDFTFIIDEVSKLIANKFERKEMADYSYIQIEPSVFTIFIILFINIIIIFLILNKKH